MITRYHVDFLFLIWIKLISKYGVKGFIFEKYVG